MIFKRTFLLLAALALLVSGCAKKEEEPVDVFAPGESLNSANELPLPSSGESELRELYISMPASPGTYHPLSGTDENMCDVFSLVTEPALRLTGSGEFEYSIIENYEISEDGLTYVFYIRKGVKFHGDYGEVTSEDLVYCLDRISKADISNCLYVRYFGAVDSYKALDDYRVQVVATEKTRDILYLMTFPVVPKAYYQSEKWTTEKAPVGTGPYKAVSYSKQAGYVLVKNTDWWKVAPVYDVIYAVPLDIKNIQLGTDIFDKLNVVDMPMLTAGSLAAAGKNKLYPVVTPYMDCLVPNVRKNALKDARVRRAVSLAINRSALITTGIMGLGEAASTPINPNFFAVSTFSAEELYNQNTANALLNELSYIVEKDTGYRYTYNADGSKRYLKLTLIYTESADFEYKSTVLSLIKTDLGTVGIQLNVEKLEQEEYAARLESGDFDLAFCSFTTSLSNDLTFLFETKNYGHYKDDALNELIKKSRSALSKEETESAFTALNEKLYADMPVITLYFKEHAMLVDEGISVSTKMCFKNTYFGINEWKGISA